MKYWLFLVIVTFGWIASDAQSSSLTDSSNLLQLTTIQDSTSLQLPNLSITEKDRKAVLRWKADSLPPAESFYAVERSTDGISFSLVGITKTNHSGWTDFIDDSPPRGKIFYRIKLSCGERSIYSAMIPATITSELFCKFYPNPVDKVLIIRGESALDVQISDQSGKPLLTDKFAGGLKVIDVSALEPGIYVITLLQKDSGRQLTEKLVKK